MKTIFNLILFVVLTIAIVILSNGSFKSLKTNGTKVIGTTISIVDSGIGKLDEVSKNQRPSTEQIETFNSINK